MRTIRGRATTNADGEGFRNVFGNGKKLRHGIERPCAIILIESGDDHALPEVGHLVAHRHQFEIEELRLVDAHNLSLCVQQRANFGCRSHQFRPHLHIAVAHNVILAEAVIQPWLKDLYALFGNLGAPEPADQLFALSAEHAAADHLDRTEAAVGIVKLLCHKPTQKGIGLYNEFPMAEIPRRQTIPVKVGKVWIGGKYPIAVQSMTNTDTADVESTIAQVEALAAAGSELVRVTVNTREAAAAVPAIVNRLRSRGVNVPIIGDFHYNGHILLREYPDCARALDKYRINPGNVGMGRQHDDNFRTIIEIALEHDKAVRIGVNWGSLDQAVVTQRMDENARSSKPKEANEVVMEAMVASALESAEMARSYGMGEDRIILSAKVSGVQDLIDVYRTLANRSRYALHLGLTEAGMGRRGIVSSTAALSVLLQEGIGDTIRVSLTPMPGGDRREEVLTCQDVLQSLGIRSFAPQVTACPGCGRTTSTVFQEMACDIQNHLSTRMSVWKTDLPGIEGLKVAVMGCVVNGPGESKHANIGISLPGTGEEPKAPVYIDGSLVTTLKGPSIVGEFMIMLDQYVEQRYRRK